jgi:hypothetical protein
MPAAMRESFTVACGACDYVLEVGGGGGSNDRDAAWHLRSLVFAASGDRGGLTERAVLGVFQRLVGRPATEWERGDLAQRARFFEKVHAELDRALTSGRLSVRQRRALFIATPVERTEVESPRAREETTEFIDVFVLAAEVKLIGDTPLIEHEVRVIDPDNGAVVAEAVTDEKGIVRVEVPAAKTYRIEIVDRELAWHGDIAPEAPQSVLRCELVDAFGTCVAHRDVVATTDDGEMTLTTDEAGRIEVPMPLGHVQLQVGDDIFDAHALLPSDQTVYQFVVSSPEEDDGPADDPANRLHRVDTRFDPDADDDSLEEVA